MTDDKTTRRTKKDGRARRRVDPGAQSEKEFVGRASGRVAKGLVDTDDSGSAADLLRLKQIAKQDRGVSPAEVTVRWVETEDE